MNLNTWSNNAVSLTGTKDVYANSLTLIDYSSKTSEDILNIFNNVQNISTCRDIIVQLGAGLFFTKTEFIPNIDETFDDNHIPGMYSLLKYLRLNYRKLDDDSVINNTYNVNNNYNSRIYNDETLYNIKNTKIYTTNNITNLHNIYDNITNFNTKHTHFKQFHHNLTQESQFVKQIINNKIIRNMFTEDITNMNTSLEKTCISECKQI